MTNLIEILIIISFGILAAAAIVGFFAVRSHLRKSVLNNDKD